MAFVLIIFTTIDDRTIIIQFTFDDRLPFSRLIVFTLQYMKRLIVFHIIDKALGCCNCQRTTVSGRVIHFRHNTDIIHQSSYILRLLGSVLSGSISRRHIIPLVRRIESGGKR